MPSPPAGSKGGEAEKPDVEGGQQRYLNVNLVYELWKDIKFSWLQHRYVASCSTEALEKGPCPQCGNPAWRCPRRPSCDERGWRVQSRACAYSCLPRVCHSHPSASVHLSRLVVLWTLLNLPFALLLIPISKYMHQVASS